MSVYDLRSLKLPKLYGKMLSMFTSAATSRLFQPLLMGSLLENGGIPTLRGMQFTEEPTFVPLNVPSTHATGPMDMPQDVHTNQRTQREDMPFNLVRDYALAYRQGSFTPLQAAEQVIQAIAESEKTSPPATRNH
jgi:hypothetical protein